MRSKSSSKYRTYLPPGFKDKQKLPSIKQRFNEEGVAPAKPAVVHRRRSVGAASSLPGDSPESRKVAHYKQRIKESVEDLDEKEIEFLREKLNIEEMKDEPIEIEDDGQLLEEEAADEVASLQPDDGKMSCRSGGSRASARSFRSSATYVTHLEKQLEEERKAREKLEKELQEIKRIASEVNSAMAQQKQE